MFMSLSKTIAKVGGFRLGIRMRLTKSNAIWYYLLLTVVLTCQLCWYGMIFTCWLIYAFFYGIYWCVSRIYRLLSSKFGKTKAIVIMLAICAVLMIVGAIGNTG